MRFQCVSASLCVSAKNALKNGILHLQQEGLKNPEIMFLGILEPCQNRAVSIQGLPLQVPVLEIVESILHHLHSDFRSFGLQTLWSQYSVKMTLLVTLFLQLTSVRTYFDKQYNIELLQLKSMWYVESTFVLPLALFSTLLLILAIAQCILMRES